MATVTDPEPQTQPAPPISIPDDRRFVLSGISGATYKALGDDLERAHSRVFITYDNGRMELMALGRIPEKY